MAENKIKLISPSEFPQLPAVLKRKIEDKGCKIPQAFISSEPHNIISGSFAAKNSKDWAVLCSKKGNTGYSRVLASASRETILKHQKAYGDPLPKKLDHQGIDDGLAEKRLHDSLLRRWKVDNSYRRRLKASPRFYAVNDLITAEIVESSEFHFTVFKAGPNLDQAIRGLESERKTSVATR